MAKKNKKYKKVFVILLAIILIIGFIRFVNKQKKSNNEKSVIILNNKDITETLKRELIIKNLNIYMSFDDVKNILDDSLYYEEETKLIIATGNKKLAAFKQDEDKILINGSNRECLNIVLNEGDEIYINISELKDVYNYEINYIQKSNIITIDNLNKKVIKAYLKRNTTVKSDAKYLSKKIEKLKKGKGVFVISDENSYLKVRTENGYIGYIKKNLLQNYETLRDDYIEETHTFPDEGYMEYDITKKDISNFEKRLNITNIILKEAVKKDKKYVKILFDKEQNTIEYERFKIEASPMLEECGIMLSFD